MVIRRRMEVGGKGGHKNKYLGVGFANHFYYFKNKINTKYLTMKTLVQ